MTTKEEVRNVMLEQMKDPSLPSSAFDEYNRRLKLLDSEE